MLPLEQGSLKEITHAVADEFVEGARSPPGMMQCQCHTGGHWILKRIQCKTCSKPATGFSGWGVLCFLRGAQAVRAGGSEQCLPDEANFERL